MVDFFFSLASLPLEFTHFSIQPHDTFYTYIGSSNSSNSSKMCTHTHMHACYFVIKVYMIMATCSTLSSFSSSSSSSLDVIFCSLWSDLNNILYTPSTTMITKWYYFFEANVFCAIWCIHHPITSTLTSVVNCKYFLRRMFTSKNHHECNCWCPFAFWAFVLFCFSMFSVISRNF